MRAVCRTLVIVATLLAGMLAVRPALASEVTSPDPGSAIPGHAAVIYRDLLNLLVTDLAAAGSGLTGHRLAPIRNLDADVQAAAPPKDIEIGRVSVIQPVGRSADRLLMLVDLGTPDDSAEGFSALALFDLAGEPKLLDAVNVAFDRFTGFDEPATLEAGAGASFVLTRSYHFNSSQNYVTTAILLVRDGRMELVDTVFTFDERGCDFERRQVTSFTATPAAGGAPAGLTVTVTETTQPAQEPCGETAAPAAATREISVTYAWDAGEGRYVAASDALLELAAENAERF